jgi:DNA-binding IclR family transcriptional regulator
MLQTREQMGYVERASYSAHYKLGIGSMRLGFEYSASMELAEHGRIVIDELRDFTGYAAHVVVRNGREVVVVAKATGRSTLFSAIQVGSLLPAHATVLGRVLLADLSQVELAALYDQTPLTAFTDRTPTSLSQIKALIDTDRQNGYGISQGGFEAASAP